MGSGRQGTTRNKARAAGDLETFERLKPPSERRVAKCGALTQDGTPCKLGKGSRTDHPGYGNCLKHGGNTQAGIKSAMKEMAADLAAQYKRDRRFGGDRTDPQFANYTPEQALLEEVRRSAAFVRFLEERIGSWNLSPLANDHIESIVHNSRYDYKKSSLEAEVKEFLDNLEQDDADSGYHLPRLSDINEKSGFVSFTDAHTWLTLYRDERAHLARVAKMCIDANISQRIVSLAEDQGRILASAIRAVLGALNLSPEQAQLVPRIVPPILRAVASDQPIPDISLLLHTNNDTVRGELA